MKKLDKDEINRLLEKAPTGAQNVVEIAEGQFVVFSKMVDGTKEEFSFYSLVAENNTEWLSFKTKKHLGNGLWLLTDFNDNQRFYNTDTGVMSNLLCFKTKEDLGNGLWLLTDSFNRKCFYNVKTNVTFVSKTKEDPSNGLWLLTDFDGNKCFYNVNTGKKSDTLSFEYYVVQNGEIVCISRYKTQATLNVETMKLGPYQVREA